MPPVISIVDDDESVRESLPDLLRSFDLQPHSFSSAEEFLESDILQSTNCLILDIAMPGMSGPALQLELKRRGHKLPTVFITANTDPVLHLRLLREGAVACLVKPFSEKAICDAIRAALAMN